MSLDPRVIEIIEDARTIAVVGCSPDPHRDSYYSARYFMDQGYEGVPINPKHDMILGVTSAHAYSVEEIEMCNGFSETTLSPNDSTICLVLSVDPSSTIIISIGLYS